VILDDFVMLGTTVPEPNSSGRVFVCSAGVSNEVRRLIRIYPLARRAAPRRWGMYRVPIQRNPKDYRDESFQLQGNRAAGAHEQINEQFEYRQQQMSEGSRAHLLSRYVVGSIQDANDRRLSLAIIQPSDLELAFDDNTQPSREPELTLFDAEDEEESGAKRFPLMPRIRFGDDRGEHNLMLRDWGAFELQRKNGPDYLREHLAKALHLTSASSLLVGNMRDHPTSWLVISVLNGIREEPDLFSTMPTDA
jgi:hypothetical protein